MRVLPNYFATRLLVAFQFFEVMQEHVPVAIRYSYIIVIRFAVFKMNLNGIHTITDEPNCALDVL